MYECVCVCIYKVKCINYRLNHAKKIDNSHIYENSKKISWIIAN